MIIYSDYFDGEQNFSASKTRSPVKNFTCILFNWSTKFFTLIWMKIYPQKWQRAIDFFSNFQKSQVMTWLLDDLTWLFLKKLTFGASLALSIIRTISNVNVRGPETCDQNYLAMDLLLLGCQLSNSVNWKICFLQIAIACPNSSRFTWYLLNWCSLQSPQSLWSFSCINNNVIDLLFELPSLSLSVQKSIWRRRRVLASSCFVL